MVPFKLSMLLRHLKLSRSYLPCTSGAGCGEPANREGTVERTAGSAFRSPENFTARCSVFGAVPRLLQIYLILPELSLYGNSSQRRTRNARRFLFILHGHVNGSCKFRPVTIGAMPARLNAAATHVELNRLSCLLCALRGDPA